MGRRSVGEEIAVCGQFDIVGITLAIHQLNPLIVVIELQTRCQ